MNPAVIHRLAACAAFVVIGACSEETPVPPTVVSPAVQPTAQPAVKPAAQPAAQTVAPPAARDADAELAARVKKALEARSTEIAQGIDVTTRRGTVSLFGTVSSDAQRRSAAGVAASVPGVTSVDNKLVVVKGS